MENIISDLIAPVITGIVTILGFLIANRKQQAIREVKEEMEKKERREWEARVESKLDEHNGYAKLFSETSVAIARIEEQVKALKERG